MDSCITVGVHEMSGIQGCIFFYNSPPPRGGKGSKALRAREGNQRVKKKRREKKGKGKGKGKGKEKGKGKGKEKERKRGKGGKRKENKSKRRKKYEGKGNEKNGQGDQCKRTEKLWNQSDNT